MSRSYRRSGWIGGKHPANMKFFKRRHHKRLRQIPVESELTPSKKDGVDLWLAPVDKFYFGKFRPDAPHFVRK